MSYKIKEVLETNTNNILVEDDIINFLIKNELANANSSIDINMELYNFYYELEGVHNIYITIDKNNQLDEYTLDVLVSKEIAYIDIVLVIIITIVIISNIFKKIVKKH